MSPGRRSRGYARIDLQANSDAPGDRDSHRNWLAVAADLHEGRPLPKDPDPTSMGYSIGKWEGDTLVAETNGLNDRGWLDGFGHPRSEQMHITERFRRRDFGHMDLEFSFNDPKYYTRPFGLKTGLKLLPDSDLLEYVSPRTRGIALTWGNETRLGSPLRRREDHFRAVRNR